MTKQLLSDIALFIEVVNTNSFTKAAFNLDMPTSTLSRRIVLLEQEIGIKLLNRTTRSVVPTEEGDAYYWRCKDLIAQALLAHEEISQVIHVPKGTLRLACTPDFATLYLAPLLIAYAKRCPDVIVELSLSNKAEDLIENHLDAAIRIGTLPDSALIARPIGTLHNCLYASQNYLADNPPITHPNDLKMHRFIKMRAGENNATLKLKERQTGEVARLKLSGQFIAGSPAMVKALILEDAGIGLLPKQLADLPSNKNPIQPILPTWCTDDVPIHVVTTSRLIPARVRILIEMLSALFV